MSIVDFLNSQGQASDFNSRSQLASQFGITNYTGSAAQNTQLLNTLRQQSTATPHATGTNVQPLASAVKVAAPASTTPSFTRDFTREKQTMQRVFGRELSTAELTPEVQSLLFRATYTPDQLRGLGIGDVGTDRMSTNPALQELGLARGVARQDMFTKQPVNTHLGVLEKALRERQRELAGEGGVEGQVERAMGAVGATGYGALAAAMQAKVAGINSNYESLASVIKSTGQVLSDEFNQALSRYKLLSDDYQALADRVFELDKMDEAMTRELEMYRQKLMIDTELGLGTSGSGSRSGTETRTTEVDATELTYAEIKAEADRLLAAELITPQQYKTLDDALNDSRGKSDWNAKADVGIQNIYRNLVSASQSSEIEQTALSVLKELRDQNPSIPNRQLVELANNDPRLVGRAIVDESDVLNAGAARGVGQTLKAGAGAISKAVQNLATGSSVQKAQIQREIARLEKTKESTVSSSQRAAIDRQIESLRITLTRI